MKLGPQQTDLVKDMRRWYGYLIEDIINPNEVPLDGTKQAIDEVITNLYKFKKTLGRSV